MTTSAGEGTGSLEKALDVLDAVGASPDGLSQGEIAARLSLPRTTAYRLLATLVARGLLRRDPLRKVYCLGFRCFEMAKQAYAMPDLVAAAAGELRALRDLTGETTYLAALDGMEVIALERYDGAHSQRSASALGQRKPVYCTSQGKAILSAMEPAARDALVRDLTLKPVTPFSITDRRRLQAEIKITAARGWSIDNEEIVMGVRCVGAPIVDSQGKVRGAISVAGPKWRLTSERVDLLGPEVAEAARRIGAELRDAAPAATDSAVQAVPGPWAFHGAYPRWSAQGRLYWADTLAPAVRCFDGDADSELAVLDAPVTGLLMRGEDLLVTHDAGATRVTGDGRTAPVTAWPSARLHALDAGDDDSIWAAFEGPGGGSVVGPVHPGGEFAAQWRLDERVQALRWDRTAERFYAAASGSGTIFILKPGSAAVRRLATIPRGSGQLSGIAVDRAGGVWTALREGWSVMRIAPDGSLDRVVGLPVPHPTDVAIGGAKADQLFITTARQPVALDTLANAPLSGRLLVAPI